MQIYFNDEEFDIFLAVAIHMFNLRNFQTMENCVNQVYYKILQQIMEEAKLYLTLHVLQCEWRFLQVDYHLNLGNI